MFAMMTVDLEMLDLGGRWTARLDVKSGVLSWREREWRDHQGVNGEQIVDRLLMLLVRKVLINTFNRQVRERLCPPSRRRVGNASATRVDEPHGIHVSSTEAPAHPYLPTSLTIYLPTLIQIQQREISISTISTYPELSCILVQEGPFREIRHGHEHEAL